MNNDHLQKLQMIFEEADEDGGGGLDIDEFRQAMKRTMGAGQVDDRQLAIVFMKVDANCDGTVDWDEYLSYMLLEYQERALMNTLCKDIPFSKPVKDIPSNHHEMLTGIAFLPTIIHRHGSVADESEHSVGRYISVSKEGTVNFWSLDLANLKSVSLEQPRDKVSPMWITDMVCMPNINMIALSSTERDICFYDVNANKFDKVFQVTGISHCAMSMDYWYDTHNMNHAVLAFGDSGGNVSVIVFKEALGSALFGAQNAKGVGSRRVPFPQLLKGQVKGIRALRYRVIHEDWVRKVRYCHNLHSVVSCATTTDASLFIGDVERKRVGGIFRIRKGLPCFEYSNEHNVIVTGGMDRTVRIWNPYVNTKATAVLKGHNTAVMHIEMNSFNGHIISVAKDKQIKVWDIRDQSCLQTIAGRNVHIGPHHINTVCYNARTGTLIIGTNTLSVFERKAEEGEDGAEPTSHNNTVTIALYNSLFNQVVSACVDSIVSVWDLDNGTKTIQFSAHRCQERGVEKSVEITTMTFDPSCRRLITGARNGTLKIWNFNNGACLRELQISDPYELTGIICSKHRIITTGWNRRITTYIDSEDENVGRQWPIRHNDDVLSLSYYAPNHIATSSYDGDIITWSLETGHMLTRMNATESVKTQTGRIATRATPCTPIRSSERDARQLPNAPDKPAHTEDKSNALGPIDKSIEQRCSRLDIEPKPIDGSTKSLTKSLPVLPRIGETVAANDVAVSAPSGDATYSDIDNNKSKLLHSPNEQYYLLNSGTYEDFQRKHEASVDKILFLQAREQDKDTATLIATGAGGWVRAWSIDHQGGLLGQFNAAHGKNESVLAMTTDAANKFLITGDTMGYVVVWDITDYCIKGDTRTSQTDMQKQFPYLQPDGVIGFRAKLRAEIKHQKSMPKPAAQTDPERTLHAPMKVNAYRGHLKSITHIEYAEDKKLILTTSTDCSVRLWTLCGRYIGTFGQKGGWEKLPCPFSPEKLPRKLPGDVRRVASSMTLKVFNAGSRPRWKLARNVLLLLGTRNLFKRKEDNKLHMAKATSLGEYMSDTDSNEDANSDTEADRGTSKILGKSYKPKTRHKMPPVLPEIRTNQTQVSVYSSLPFSELDEIPEAKLPAVIQQIHARQLSLDNYEKESTKNKLKRRIQDYTQKQRATRLLNRDQKDQ
ncbi:WD repeat-containing protein on Y chromosome-like [Saccoglossus kowalevskii]